MTYDHPTALKLETADLPPETRRYFDICQEKLGLIPNVLLAYAHNVAHLDAFTAAYNDLMLGESGLSKLEREMIAVVVSSQNHCHYCIIAHGAALRELSGDAAWADTLAVNYRAAELSARQRAICDFAVKVTRASAEVEEADRQSLRDAGLSEAEIWDLAAVAGFFNMSNRMASALGMRPNDGYYSAGR